MGRYTRHDVYAVCQILGVRPDDVSEIRIDEKVIEITSRNLNKSVITTEKHIYRGVTRTDDDSLGQALLEGRVQVPTGGASPVTQNESSSSSGTSSEPVIVETYPTGLNLMKLDHVHQKGYCIKNRFGKKCPPNPSP